MLHMTHWASLSGGQGLATGPGLSWRENAAFVCCGPQDLFLRPFCPPAPGRVLPLALGFTPPRASSRPLPLPGGWGALRRLNPSQENASREREPAWHPHSPLMFCNLGTLSNWLINTLLPGPQRRGPGNSQHLTPHPAHLDKHSPVYSADPKSHAR